MAYKRIISIGERAYYLVRQIITDSCLHKPRDGNVRHHSRRIGNTQRAFICETIFYIVL